MKIAKALLKDFAELYKIGRKTKEFRVSANEEFMAADEFKYYITNPKACFLVAKDKEKEICGFILANADDIEKPFKQKYACIIYIIVVPKFRRQGIAKKLYFECIKQLKKKGIKNVYSWANSEGKRQIVKFFKKQGFAEGHKYIWMDKRIT